MAGSVGSSVSFFMAYNTTQTGDHSTFDGPYNYLRITGATSIDIPGLPVSVDRSYGLSSARGEDWTIWSLELSRSVSLGTLSPLPVSASGSITSGKGGCKFFNKGCVGSPKGTWDQVKGWGKALPIIGMGAIILNSFVSVP